MEGHQVATIADAATILASPRRSTPLGELWFEPCTKEPLGGLNPHSHHFDQIGASFKNICIEHAGLRHNHRILDIGCGTGRLAKPLSQYLDGGKYVGLDVNRRFIDYCRSAPYPKCEFTHVDVRHDEYNPAGMIDPSTFQLPFEDKSFDLVTAVAVFNHLRTPWIFQYVREVSRVLRPRGTFLCTMLLLNQRSMQFINKRATQPYAFPHRTPESWHDFELRPLFNVAHPEEALRRVCIKSGLMVKEPIRYGEWCNGSAPLSGPDVIITRRGGWHH